MHSGSVPVCTQIKLFMSNCNVYLASKPRYEILDGLRGVAAVLVVAYHLFKWVKEYKL